MSPFLLLAAAWLVWRLPSLASYGVEVLTVDRHPAPPSIQEQGTYTSALSNSCALWDLRIRFRSSQPLSIFRMDRLMKCIRLQRAKLPHTFLTFNGGVEEFSPSRRLFVAQDAIEPLLRSKAIEYGADLVYVPR